MAYEATSRQWWASIENDDFITKHDFFADLKAKNVSFYDRTKKAKAQRPPVFQIATDTQYSDDAQNISFASSMPIF